MNQHDTNSLNKYSSGNKKKHVHSQESTSLNSRQRSRSPCSQSPRDPSTEGNQLSRAKISSCDARRNVTGIERNVKNLFFVHPGSKYDSKLPTLRKPQVFGEFSLGKQRVFFHDQRNLNFIDMDWKAPKKVAYDLNIGYENAIKRDYDATKKEKLQFILRWLLLNRTKFIKKDSNGKPIQSIFTDFVCFRGLLTELMCTLYEGREGWIVCATKYRGTIYLSAYETPARIIQRENQEEMQKRMSSWGYKFEQYMINGSDLTEAVDENEEFCIILRSRLDKYSLLYGGEMDGADPASFKTSFTDLEAFLELKTSKLPTSDKDFFSLERYKYIKWWCQSFLVGIPRIVWGQRDNNGIVQKLEVVQVSELPAKAKGRWNTNRMLNFLDRILGFIQEQVKEDNPEVVYKFERRPNGGDVECSFLGKDPEWTFLPSWYYDNVFQPENDINTEHK